jgi:transposase
LKIQNKEYSPLLGDIFEGTSVYRYNKTVYGKNLTVVVTDNENLRKSQLVGIMANIDKCISEFNDLTERLKKREDGLVKKGIMPTLDSVSKNVKKILSGDHMSKIFSYEIHDNNGQISFQYSKSNDNLELVKNQYLGKTMLFTDRNEWTSEQIVSAYRSQYHVEESFKQMKNTSHLTFRPIRHFTDRNIVVHSFYCVLAYTLSCLLQLEMKNLGFNMSINSILKGFSEGVQTLKIKTNENNNKIVLTMLSKVSDETKAYIEKYNLQKYIIK